MFVIVHSVFIIFGRQVLLGGTVQIGQETFTEAGVHWIAIQDVSTVGASVLVVDVATELNEHVRDSALATFEVPLRVIKWTVLGTFFLILALTWALTNPDRGLALNA